MNDLGGQAAVEILLVEDNAGDVRLTREIFKEGRMRNTLNAVGDGVEALKYLRREGEFAGAAKPDLILLDLNLPKMDGRELLSVIKFDPELQRIPVVVLTTSTAEADVLRTYDLHANCYVVKPVRLDQFESAVRAIEDFWLSLVRLPASRD